MAGLKRFRLGLVVGKFAPLHLGHVALVEHAAAQCDRLLLLSYSHPEIPGCEPARRRRWLAEACPGHEHIALPADSVPPNAAGDATHQHHLAALLAGPLQRRPDAMFASETYVGPCADVLSAALGHPVTPVLFDPARARVPVSAAAIRARPAAMLDWLPPVVRADWVPRVALLGGESTGKSTLAAALAAHWRTAWVAEYGRERWEAQGGHLTEPDLLAIATEQGRREDLAARTAAPVLVCDTSPLTTLGYAHWWYGSADPALTRLADRPYTLNVLCGDDILFDQDGTRRDAAFRGRQQAWYRDQLQGRGRPWIEVGGPVAVRVDLVVRALASRGATP